MYRSLLFLGLICGVLLLPELSLTQSTDLGADSWQKQLLRCFSEKSPTACPVRLFELDVDDPTDELDFLGDRGFHPYLSLKSFIHRERVPRLSNSPSLSCEIIGIGVTIGCIQSSAQNPAHLFLDQSEFVWFTPPYHRNIEHPV